MSGDRLQGLLARFRFPHFTSSFHIDVLMTVPWPCRALPACRLFRSVIYSQPTFLIQEPLHGATHRSEIIEIMPGILDCAHYKSKQDCAACIEQRRKSNLEQAVKGAQASASEALQNDLGR